MASAMLVGWQAATSVSWLVASVLPLALLVLLLLLVQQLLAAPRPPLQAHRHRQQQQQHQVKQLLQLQPLQPQPLLELVRTSCLPTLQTHALGWWAPFGWRYIKLATFLICCVAGLMSCCNKVWLARSWIMFVEFVTAYAAALYWFVRKIWWRNQARKVQTPAGLWSSLGIN